MNLILRSAGRRASFLEAIDANPSIVSGRLPSNLLYLLVLGALLALILPPLIVLFLASLKPAAAMPFDHGNLTLENYIQLFSDPEVLGLALNTAFFAAASLLLGLILAVPIVWLVERTDIPFKNLISTVMFVPLIIPGMLTAFGWVLLLAPKTGFINVWIRSFTEAKGSGPLDIYTVWGLIFLTAISIVPGMFIMLSALFRNMDPQLEEAALASGSGTRHVLYRITLPLMFPGVVSVAIYYTIILVEMFEVPLAIGLNANFPVLSIYIYNLIHSDYAPPSYGLAGAFGVVMVAIGIALARAYLKLTQRSYRYAIVKGQRSARRMVRLGRWKYVALFFIVFYLCIKVGLPFFALLWSSLFASWTPLGLAPLGSMTLQVYRLTFRDPRLFDAAVNSVVLLSGAGTGTMLLAVLVSWFVVRGQGAPTKWLDALAFIPRSIPAVVTSLGVLLFFIYTPLYGTIWLLIVGHTINYLPFAVRSTNSALLQIHGELEEASRVSGAGTAKTLRRIVIPLLRPAVWNSWLWIVAHSIKDFTFPLMLGTSTNLVIAQLLWQYWQLGNAERASALAVALICCLTLLVFPMRYYLNRHQAF